MNKKKYYHQNINRWKAKMMFKRKVYEELLAWKKEWDGKYACLLEGARRVGKTTIAEEFARNEYDSYILIDFSNTSKEMMDIFDDISKLDRFFLRLQMEVGVELYNHVKDLPIIDYHSHLNEYEIQSNYDFKTITELWFKVDHYK